MNIESQRIQSDSIRYTGNANFVYNYQEINKVPLNVFKSSIVFQSKSKSYKDILLFLANYEFSNSNKLKLSNSAFIHVRYNRKLTKLIRWEIYNQLQYNQLLNLYSRYIAGTGLRMKISNHKSFKSYIGLSSFYEYEETLEEKRTYKNDFRMSNYLVLSYKFLKEKGELTSTTYFQPLYSDLKDFRITNQSQIVLNFTKNISFTTTINYFFDRIPPVGIDKETFSFENGLRLTF